MKIQTEFTTVYSACKNLQDMGKDKNRKFRLNE